MHEQQHSGSYNGQKSLEQQHLMSTELDQHAGEDGGEDSAKVSARRKIEDKLEELRLRRLTQDFDFDDL